MYYNRFDIAEAYYLFLDNFHEGQDSDKYKRLCHMSKYFKPRALMAYHTLTNNGKAIYDNLINTYKDYR